MNSSIVTDPIVLKRCGKCHDWAPLSHFGKATRSQDGLRETCLDCRQLDYELNKAEILASQVATRAARTPEQKAAKALKNTQYYQKNRDKWPKHAQKRRENHPEALRAYFAQYYLDNREEGKIQRAEWRKTHPQERQNAEERRRARKVAAPLNDLTHEQWVEIQEAQGHRCYYCQKRCKGHLTQDHIIPFVQGGSHTLHNVIAACRSCNSKKGRGNPLIPVQPFLLTIAPAKQFQASNDS